jgi:hypothetical protein
MSESDPVDTQEFNRERFARIGILTGSLFDVASFTLENKESLLVGMARSLG